MENQASCLSVLVPAYNEQETIQEVLRRVLELGPIVKEVIVVDDGSSDDTPKIVARMAEREPRIRLFVLAKNQGKTAAVRHALQQANGDLIVIQDADLEYDPADIPDLIAPLLSRQADVVYGSRFLVKRASRVLYFYHYVANTLLTFFSNLLTNCNMTDIETCYKAFRSGVIKPLTLGSKGFGMEVEITAMVSKTKARIYEVPISYYGRTYEEGKKVTLKDGLMAICYIIYYNLIRPRLPSGRRYRRQVNDFLSGSSPKTSQCARHAPPDATASRGA